MKTKELTQLQEVTAELIILAGSFPHQKRMMWAIENNVHLETVNRYLRGKASSLPLAKMLRDHIKALPKPKTNKAA